METVKALFYITKISDEPNNEPIEQIIDKATKAIRMGGNEKFQIHKYENTQTDAVDMRVWVFTTADLTYEEASEIFYKFMAQPKHWMWWERDIKPEECIYTVKRGV